MGVGVIGVGVMGVGVMGCNHNLLSLLRYATNEGKFS